MKKIKILIITFLLILISCKSKLTNNNFDEKMSNKEINYIPYYLKVYEADSLYMIKDYKKSFSILDSLFDKFEPRNTTSYYEYGKYLETAFKTNNLKDIKTKVENSYIKFGELSINSNNIKDSLLKICDLNVQKISALKQIYFNNLNSELRTTLKNILKEDQNCRVSNYNEDSMAVYQKKHYYQIKQIFIKYGYPSAKLVGSIVNYDDLKEVIDLTPILVHQSHSAVNELSPQILNFVKSGECEPRSYAAMIDKRLVVKENKQYYGSFVSENYEYNKNYPLINPKKIDSIRNSIGLPKMNYEYWRNIIFLNNN